MKQSGHRAITPARQTADGAVSRRSALGSSGVAVLALLSGSALGKMEEKRVQTKTPAGKLSKEFLEREEHSRTLAERMRNAESAEERRQIMDEEIAWQRQRAVDDLKTQLGLSDQEWSVVKPRLQAVYDLVHARTQTGRNEPPKTEVEQRSRELRELLRDEKVAADQIKARLTALRAAKERTVQELAKARQGLRQLMTLRQEALLVLNGLLD